ncbi:MAG: magnesium chelatase, partial [Pseudomonadota bacterium]
MALTSSASSSVKVVILTMDTHLNSAAIKARNALVRQVPNLSFAIHSASEYSADAQKLARCQGDIASADIIIVSMLFLEDHFQPILPDLQARRDHCTAMVCIMSAAEVVKLTRMGKLDMGKPSTGPMAFLKKLRGSKPQAGQDASAGARQMKMLRRLPQILRFVPGTAQDLRAYFLTLQYWLGGSQENIHNLVLYLVDRYAKQALPDKSAALKVSSPAEYPEVGVYHPRMQPRLHADLAQLPQIVKPQAAKGRVGVLLLRSYLIASNTQHYDAVIAALEVQGLQVVPVFATGLDSRPAIEAFFIEDGQCTVDAVISLTGFSLVGGPAYNDAHAAEEILGRLDVPYIAAHPVEFQTLDQWGGSSRGLLPVESTIMIAIPELDGSVVPMVYGGRPGADGVTCTGCHQRCTFTKDHHQEDMFTCTERTAMLAMRVAKLVALRRSERAQRRVAMVIFNFPPNAGNTGTAAYLAVFESLYNTMKAMKAQGYSVDLPASCEALEQSILEGNRMQYGADANVHTLISAEDHVRRERYLADIEAHWGPAPGKLLSNGESIFVLGQQFGNLLVTVQPAFGHEGDPMRLLFEGGFAPTHAFSAFYRYLREDFAAHAVLHFGTHGSLEFMPGKQTGLAGSCWPDRLIDDLP